MAMDRHGGGDEISFDALLNPLRTISSTAPGFLTSLDLDGIPDTDKLLNALRLLQAAARGDIKALDQLVADGLATKSLSENSCGS